MMSGMDIAGANTEPFYQFHRFSEELNRDLRIAVAGLALVKQAAAQDQTSATPIQLPIDGEPWGTNFWRNPTKAVAPARRFVSQMGVVRIVAALEDFCIGVKAEHDRYNRISGEAAEHNYESDETDEGISPSKLYSEVGWKKDSLDSLSPLYEYFSKVRNCIVHRSGRASSELNKYAASERLAKCVGDWHGPRKKKLPALPNISTGNDLSLLPRHAILAGEVCRRIAVDANEKLLKYLGVEGLAYMAAYHSLLSSTPVVTNARSSAQAVLNFILTNRYRAKLAYREEAVQILGRLGKWKPYLRKFERMS
jgi:hypothetical protein